MGSRPETEEYDSRRQHDLDGWKAPCMVCSITTPLKTKWVNIGTEVEPKYEMLGDYWETKLLCEYQDLFPTKIKDLKWIVGELGMVKITLKLEAEPVKKRPYRLNLKYKEKVHIELEKILTAGIIEPMEEFDWVSPMVV